jgi:hypothetical protein
VAALGLAVALTVLPRLVVFREGSVTTIAVQSEVAWPLPEGALTDKTPVPAAAFDRLDRVDAPRVEERWERDPCRRVYDTPASLRGENPEGGVANRGMPAELPARDFTGPPLPDGSLATATSADGFRVEYTSDRFVVPVLRGQEVVVHVLAWTHVAAAPGLPTLRLGAHVELPASFRGHFRELEEALFARANQSQPGVVVVEGGLWGVANDDVHAFVGSRATAKVHVTRLHVRPTVDAIELVTAEGFVPHYTLTHPLEVALRCGEPGATTAGPPDRPVADPPPVPTPPDLLDLDVPELGLHRDPGPAWAALPPFERGGALGAAFGLGALVLVRRRR